MASGPALSQNEKAVEIESCRVEMPGGERATTSVMGLPMLATKRRLRQVAKILSACLKTRPVRSPGLQAAVLFASSCPCPGGGPFWELILQRYWSWPGCATENRPSARDGMRLPTRRPWAGRQPLGHTCLPVPRAFPPGVPRPSALRTATIGNGRADRNVRAPGAPPLARRCPRACSHSDCHSNSQNNHPMKTLQSIALLLACAAGLTTTRALAQTGQTVTWAGGNSYQSWLGATNWTPQGRAPQQRRHQLHRHRARREQSAAQDYWQSVIRKYRPQGDCGGRRLFPNGRRGPPDPQRRLAPCAERPERLRLH